MRKLFLEGNSKIGKSSMLLSELKDALLYADGFCTVRLLDKNKKPIGFKLIKASEYEYVETDFKSDDETVFLKFDEKEVFRKEVFLNYGMKYLEKTADSKFFILDEIGGGELLEDCFFEKLISVLKGNVPCIGVLKSEKNSELFAKKVLQSKIYKERYEYIRKIMRAQNDAAVCNMDIETKKRAQELILEWKRNIEKEGENNVGAL